MEWQRESIVIGDVVRKGAAATAGLFESKPLSLMLDLPEDLPILLGDPEKMMQVIINLISNAVKFTDQGIITIKVESVNHEVVVSVSDTGIGIAQSDQALIFEKFRQAGDPLTGKPKGTGLGLAISKEIVEHHGGRIWFESEPGKGSKFAFSLPIDQSPDSQLRVNGRLDYSV